MCHEFAVSDCLVSSATEGSHCRRAPRAPAPRHAVVNKYLLRTSKIIYCAVVKKSLLLGLYDGRLASSARSCATRRSSKPDAVVKTSRKAVVKGVVN